MLNQDKIDMGRWGFSFLDDIDEEDSDLYKAVARNVNVVLVFHNLIAGRRAVYSRRPRSHRELLREVERLKAENV